MSNFKECFKELTTKRTEEVWTKAGETNKEIMQIDTELAKLQGELLKDLTEDQRSMFLKYEEQANLQLSYLRQLIYKIAFKDGISVVSETDEEIMMEDLG